MNHDSIISRVPFLTDPEKLHFIDGGWRKSKTEETIETYNPATGRLLAKLARGRKEDVDTAVEAARRAFNGDWSKFTPQARYDLLLKVKEVLMEHYEELALIESLDMGAPISRTRAMRKGLNDTIMYFASQAVNWTGSTIPNSLPGDCTTLTFKAPVGVVGGIIPWNGPLISMWWIMGGALATGCTAVIKTAEDASLTALRTAELLHQAGVPPGVINIVTGYGNEAGAALAEHMDVDRIAFTGSTRTGREIIRASASNMKRIQIELGGKSPDLIFADADIDAAVRGAAMGVYTNSGQICSAGTRIFVERKVYDEFLEKFIGFTKDLVVGDPFEEATQLGPLISQRQQDTVLRYVSLGQSEGATLEYGGNRFGEGFYVEPTVFSGVRNDMRIAQEEIFGPVASIIPFDGIDEGLEMANDTIYGLAGAVWTKSLVTAMKASHGIKAGKIWVNSYGLADAAVGFSGYKQSGYGMKGGAQHIEGFLYEKSVYIRHD